MMGIAISNPFVTQVKKCISDVGDKEYVHLRRVDRIADGYDAAKSDQFLIKVCVEEYERVPIDEYINSFDSSVGLKNLLKGIVSKTQMDALIEKTQAEPYELDATLIPNSELEMEKLVGSIDSIWEGLPSELKGDLTKEEFIKTITAQKVQEYVASQVAQINASKAKEGENV